MDEWDEHQLAMELHQAKIERIYATYWPDQHEYRRGWLVKSDERQAKVARAVAAASG